MSKQELGRINAQIKSIEQKVDFSRKHRGAVSEARYISSLRELKQQRDKIIVDEKMEDILAENNELEAEIPELTIKRDSLIEVINELEAELAELKIVHSYIENH